MKCSILDKGKPIVAPHWFIESMPSIALDGELWAGRGEFNHVQKTVLVILSQIQKTGRIYNLWFLILLAVVSAMQLATWI